jgi:hypothetical protein
MLSRFVLVAGLVILGRSSPVQSQESCSDPGADFGCVCVQQGTYYDSDCPLLGYAQNQVACCPAFMSPPTFYCSYSVAAYIIQVGDGRCCVLADPYDPSKGYVLYDDSQRSCPLCGDQFIDDARECCVNGEAVAKHPIGDLSKCPNRVAHPGHVPGFNGCGPAALQGVQFIIPQGYKSASFTDACNGHDVCYDTCNTNKGTCDMGFGESMVQSCTETYQPIISDEADPILKQRFNYEFTLCKLAAFRFFNAVSLAGQGAFDSAQKDACDCCP